MKDQKFGELHEVDEGQLLALMKDWRRGRATRSLRQAVADAYVAIFGLLVIGAMIISGIVQTQQNSAACDSSGCITGRGLLPWAALAGALAFTLAVSVMFGPVLASAAEGFWLMEAPIGRRRLLSRRLWMALGAALLLGSVFGALVSVLTGSGGFAIVAWTLGTGFGAAGLVGIAAVEQVADRAWVLRLMQALFSLLGLAALGVVVSTAANWFAIPGLEVLGPELALIIAGVGGFTAVLASVLAWRRLDLLRRRRVTSGGALLSGMQGAMFALDFGLMHDILVERNAALRGHVRPTRGVGQGLTALIMRDVQRLFRFPRPLLAWLASMIVPYALAGLGLANLAPVFSAMVLMIALIPFFGSLRVLSRTKGLIRCFPFSTGAIRTATMAVPSVLALIWAGAVTPAFVGVGSEVAHRSLEMAVATAGITGLAGMLAAVRWVSAKPANYSMPMMSVGFGALPPGMMINLIRGFEVAALITLPMVIGWSYWVSVMIAAISFSILRSGKDQQSLLDEREEQQRKLEEAKAAARGGSANSREKIKVQRRR